MLAGSAGQGLWLASWARYLVGARLAPFVPTPHHVAAAMLALAAVGPGDAVLDLGCGDGRLLIAAAKLHGARGHGVELDPKLLAAAQKAVSQQGLGASVTLSLQDAESADLSAASVVTLYLSERGNRRLLPRLRQQLRPKARVVSFCWSFGNDIMPSAMRRVDGIPLYLYTAQALRATSL
eukprot:SM000072S21198  [mRNA]  locus=s72:246127:247355:- [translate_table: standard]